MRLSVPPSSRLDRARRALGRHEDEAGFRGGRRRDASSAGLPTGLPTGLPVGLPTGLHEWFGPEEDDDGFPPLAVLIDRAWEAMRADAGWRVCWIGRRCWPYPPALVARGRASPDDRLLRASLYVDARSREEMVWSAELAARTPGVAVVIADGTGLRMPESRRLHLAASHAGCPVLLARPAREVGELSAAGARWRVSPTRDGPGSSQSNEREQVWSVSLLRSKSGREAWAPDGSARRWVAQRDHATGTIDEWQTCDGDLAAEVVGGPDASAGSRIA